VRAVFQTYVMIPGLKAVVAHFMGNPEGGIVRPPLVALTRQQTTALLAALEPLGFDMPGL
jgi:4-hydroxy-tetrahydrodipicolinate synthase